MPLHALRRQPMLLPDAFVFRRWRQLACLAFSLVALWVILRRIDLLALRLAIRHLRIEWLLTATISFGLSLVASAIRWHYVLRLLGLAVHSSATMRTVWIGHFLNALLFGPAGGDVAKSALYARWFGFPLPDVLASSVADRFVGGVGNILFFLVAASLSWSSGIFSKLTLDWISPFKIFIFVAAALLAFAVAHWLRIRSGKSLGVEAFLERLRCFGKELRRKKGLGTAALLASFFAQVTYNASLALCLKSIMHTPLSWTTLLWTLPVISLVGGLPISVAGVGVREASAMVLFGLCGVSASDAVASSLLLLGIFTIWAVWGGFVAWREELAFIRSAPAGGVKNISVVIPTLNEEQSLPNTLRCVRQVPEVTELIIADGGSSDATLRIARDASAQIVSAPRGRGLQLRAGAALASGDVILMIHADTWISPRAGRAIANALRDRTVVAGGFWKRFDRPSWLMRGSRLRCALRLWLGHRFLGDQALFTRREVLEQIGGVPAVPLMEEFELCRLLRERGRLALASDTVVTSTRRFQKLGVIRTYTRMAAVTLLYRMGVPLQRLRRLYEKD